MSEREVASVYDFTCSIYNKTGNGFFFCGGAVVEGSPVHVKLAEMANLVKWIRTL